MKIIPKNACLWGSYPLYIKGIIKRVPNDIDILVDDKDNIFEVNNEINKLKQNLTVINDLEDTFYFKNFIIDNKGKNLKINYSIYSNIEKYIVDDRNFKIIDLRFLLCALISKSFDYLKGSKISNALNDAESVLEYYGETFNNEEFVQIFLDYVDSSLNYKLIFNVSNIYNLFKNYRKIKNIENYPKLNSLLEYLNNNELILEKFKEQKLLTIIYNKLMKIINDNNYKANFSGFITYNEYSILNDNIKKYFNLKYNIELENIENFIENNMFDIIKYTKDIYNKLMKKYTFK